MRTLFFYPFAFLISLTSLVVGFVVSLFPGGRRGLFFIARRFWAPLYIWAAGAKLTVTGERDTLDPRASYIFVANHASYLDIPVLFYILDDFDIAFVAKRELAYFPLLGWYMWRLGCPIVDRGRHKRAVKTMERAAETIRTGTPVFVFAEGTRTRDGRIGPFKKGAAVLALSAGVDVVPVTIQGTFAICSKVRLAVKGGPVHVHIDEPVPTDGLTHDDRSGLTARLRDVITARYAELGGPPDDAGDQPGDRLLEAESRAN